MEVDVTTTVETQQGVEKDWRKKKKRNKIEEDEEGEEGKQNRDLY